MFSRARQSRTAKRPTDFRGGMETVCACLRIIWEAQYDQDHKLEFWALENPVGYLRRFLGKPALTFEPYWFGHNKSKATDLWGNFNQPKPTFRNGELLPSDATRQRPTAPPGYEHIKDRAAIRSITPPAFAKAFFKANP